MNFGVEGEKRLRMVLQIPIDQIKDLRPAWELIRDDFAKRNRDWLDSEGRGSFAPLSPKYAEWKRRHFGELPILRLTGRLRQSLTETSDGDFLYAPERLRVLLGTKVKYARYHQVGTKRMPRRPPVVVGKDAAFQWAKIIHRHLFESGQFRQASPIPRTGRV